MSKKLFICLVFVLLLSLGLTFGVNAQDRPDLLIWADATRAPVLTELAQQFSDEFGLNVSVQEIALGNIRSDIGVAGPAGEGPDIIVATHDWIGELVLNGSVVPIDLGDKAAEFSETSLKLFTYNGELYGMPYAVENVAFFRNPDLVPNAPATWDEVRTITEELVSSGASKYGYMIQTNDPYHFQPLMSAFGGYVFGMDADGNYNADDVGIDSPGAVAAGEWLSGMAEAGYIVPAVDYDVMHTMFETGEAAMIVTGPWALPRLKTAGANYAISNIPAGDAGPGQPFIGGQGFMLSAFSDDERRLYAEAFLLDFMANEAPMQALYDADPRPPAYLPVREKIDDPDLVAFDQAGAAGIPQPSIPQMTSVWGAWGNAEQFIINNELEPEQALSDAAEVIRTLIAGGGETTSVAPATSGDTPPADGPQAVSVPGTIQVGLGCAGDWAPECEQTQLLYNANSNVWMNTFNLEVGDYEYKVAINGTWDENYGVGGEAGGANVPLSVAEAGPVTFVYDPATHVVADSVNSVLASVPGDFQSELGCAADWAPECLRTWLQDPDGDGVYTFTTTAIPAGDYQAKVAVNMTWDENYGVDGAANGDNVTFNVPADGAETTFSWDSNSKVLTVTAA
jgi:arabinogalactan oligomer/maltooligosaccharide transport system substrate-binding protein